jgi:hypothetical protein
MTLKTALRACGYTMKDLWDRVLAKGTKVNHTDFLKCSGAMAPGKRPWWNDILSCLDDMGVDW